MVVFPYGAPIFNKNIALSLGATGFLPSVLCCFSWTSVALNHHNERRYGEADAKHPRPRTERSHYMLP